MRTVYSNALTENGNGKRMKTTATTTSDLRTTHITFLYVENKNNGKNDQVNWNCESIGVTVLTI